LRNADIVQFPWGVDLQRFHSQAANGGLRSTWSVDSQDLVILFTRGFEPIHQPLLFLEALRQVLKKNSTVHAVMLGNGRLFNEAKAFIAMHGLTTHVILPGRVANEQLSAYHRSSDVYVSTTRSDGSSISLLEAMACGRPAIVPDAYGNPEWVTSGENGFLYSSGNATALAEKVLLLVNDRRLAARLGEKGAHIARERADWNRNCDRLLNAYDRLTTSHSADRPKES